ncbi:MAG: phenylacetate-CoA oxygenase subunit PaaI [Gemmatimonadota bacterium]|nr:phenylacetate-CoA oxygenase subunit PaaI [Gemmatimonadota bacterium]
MSTSVATPDSRVESAAELPEAARDALCDLLLALADSKRLLGIRYADWMLGAPMLEAGIAASSMAQDEWGHGRLTYALLGDFGEDPKLLEHERAAGAYRSMQPLDRKPDSWCEMIAWSLLLDTALTTQYEALLESRYTPVHNRVQKMLDEEQFHFQYAAGWARRISRTEETRDQLRPALAAALPEALRWLGREGTPSSGALLEAGLVSAGPDALRHRFLSRVRPVLDEALGGDAVDALLARPLDWSGWDDATRRAGGPGPDAETLARVRGDKNRAMLLD